jgi:sulfhydrogenase subunit beta (sulfur reductase)
MTKQLQSKRAALVEPAGVGQMIEVLWRRGYQVTGPTRRSGAVVYDDLRSLTDLPAGWTDEQDGGTYRLIPRGDGALFGYALGPHTWKKYLQLPRERLWSARRSENSFEVESQAGTVPRRAFLGVRPCELHAIDIQDRVFRGGPYVDPSYSSRRENIFVVAVNCGHAGGTCFCVSMNTGPRARSGYDLLLTELLEGGNHSFVVETGTEAGASVLVEVPQREATEEEIAAARRVVSNTAARMGRTLETSGIKELLYHNYEHLRWEEVARRCLSCANCTIVCPTCFCSTVEDVTDLAGEQAERLRRWDSCFTMDHSYLHGGSVRSSTLSRYRQWMIHKLATWIDQFGTSGCVGCGRCITWCPVGIDLTAEAGAIREQDGVQ